MSTLDDRSSVETDAAPLLRESQRLDQPTFLAIYERMPDDFKAELIDGVVHLMAMSVFEDHARSHASLTGLLYLYSVETPGTVVQSRGRRTKTRGPGNTSFTTSRTGSSMGSRSRQDASKRCRSRPMASSDPRPSPACGSTRRPSSERMGRASSRHSAGAWRAPSMPISSSDCGQTGQTGLDGGVGAIRMVVSPKEQGRPAPADARTRHVVR